MRYSQNKLCNVLAFGFGIFFIYPGKLIVQLLCMLQLHATFELEFAQRLHCNAAASRWWWWRRARCRTATTTRETTTWCTINRQDVHSYLFSHFKCLVFAWENRHFPQLYLREIRIRQKKHILGKLTVLEIDRALPCTIRLICKFEQKIVKSFRLLIPQAEVNVSHPSLRRQGIQVQNIVAFNWVSWNMWPVHSSGAGLASRTKTGKTLS